MLNTGVTGTFDSNGNAMSVAGLISGSGNLSKINAGTLTLSNSVNSFTGNITVNAGTLVAGAVNNGSNPTATALGNTQLASRSITVNNGGELEFTASNVLGATTGTASVATPITIYAGGSVVDAANNNNIGPVTLSGGTLTATGNGSANFYSWMLSPSGTITVNTAPSLMAGNGTSLYSGYNLGLSSTFNVAPPAGPGYDLRCRPPWVIWRAHPAPPGPW